MLLFLIKSILYPLKSNQIENNYKENNNLFNFVLTDSRKENKINFYFNKKILKEFFLINMKMLEEFDASKCEEKSEIFSDMISFIFFFRIYLANQVKSLIKQNERRSKVRDILNKKTEYDSKEDDDEETNESSCIYISDKRKHKIIDDDDDEEENILFE